MCHLPISQDFYDLSAYFLQPIWIHIVNFLTTTILHGQSSFHCETVFHSVISNFSLRSFLNEEWKSTLSLNTPLFYFTLQKAKSVQLEQKYRKFPIFHSYLKTTRKQQTNSNATVVVKRDRAKKLFNIHKAMFDTILP